MYSSKNELFSSLLIGFGFGFCFNFAVFADWLTVRHGFRSRNPENRLPHVLPTTYEDIVLYLEGKRSLDQLLAHDGSL
jgi:hypothetical protein